MIQLFPSRAIALIVGPLSIHWYGIMYAIAFFLGMLIIPHIQRLRKLDMTREQMDFLFTTVILGVLIGGRLGYVLFYNPSYYLQHPLDVLKVWEGGMASHGGFVGVTIALLIYSYRYSLSLWALADILVVPVAIGLALGRVGNFINGELYGTITTMPWGMHFPGAEGLRHPVQLYAVAKDLFIAAVCFLHLRKTQQQPVKYGLTAGFFLVLYGMLRTLVETWRDQPFGYVSLGFLHLSWGQIYSFPLILAGLVVISLVTVRSGSRKKSA